MAIDRPHLDSTKAPMPPPVTKSGGINLPFAVPQETRSHPPKRTPQIRICARQHSGSWNDPSALCYSPYPLPWRVCNIMCHPLM